MHNFKESFILLCLTCLAMILLSSPQIWAETYVEGTIDTDTTWTIAGSPYNITSFIEIASGTTLTIEPGVTINGSGVYIGVWGTLNAIGNSGSKIIFNNTPIIGRENNENGNFLINVQFAIFYGGYISPNNSPTFGSIILKDSELYNTTEIVHLWYPREDTYIERNIFNDAYGIYFGVSPNKKVYIRNNVFYVSAERNQHQGYHAIRNFSNYDNGSVIENNSFLSADRIVVSLSCLGADSINSQNNFWNTTDINVIDNMIYDKKDTIGVCNYVSYIPFLTSANPDTPILKHLLTINKTGSGTGIVTSNPFGINYGNDCLEAYNQGTVVTLTAMPAADSVFINWTGDYTGSDNPTTINMGNNKNITANFNQNCIHSLTIVINTSGSGTVTKNPDKANYCHDEQVTLIAIPNSGYNFSLWNGVNSSSGATAQVTMNNNKTITATFSQIPIVNYTLSLSKSGNGSVNVNGTIHALPWAGQFPSGTDIQIEAVPDGGWSFTDWSGDYLGSTNPTTINWSGNKSITANFSQNCDKSLAINISPPNSGTVTKNPDKGNYCDNEQVLLTASPNEGYNFSSWEGVDSSSGLTANLTMNDNKTVEANFTQQEVNEPEINVAPGFRNFGNIDTGQSSIAYFTHVSNWGSGDLVLGSLAITGENAWAFSKLNDTCSGQTLGYAEACTVDIIFTPSTTGSFRATLEIPSNDADESSVAVDLTGSSGPDLTGNWLFLTPTCKNTKKGIKCNIKSKLNIQNIGTKDAISSVVRFYVSDDDVYDAGDIFLKKVSTGKLKVGKSTNKSFAYNFKIGNSAAGKYVIAVLDEDNKVVEADEGNNSIVYGPIP